MDEPTDIKQRLLAGIGGLAARWCEDPAACDRLADLLEAIPADEAGAAGRRTTAARIAALALMNAFLLQENRTPGAAAAVLAAADPQAAAAAQWRGAAGEAGRIFEQAQAILAEIPAGAADDLRAVARTVGEITAAGPPDYDLMGRLYHWMLSDAKHLGAFYTSVPAAAMLAELALNAEWDCEFTADFKAADLTCGTGTLLVAAATALAGRLKDASDVRRLAEDSVFGYDILPSAARMAATALLLLGATDPNVRAVPIGIIGGEARLGSLDLLGQGRPHALLQGGEAGLPEFDFCIMNPPYVRSTGGNALFGSMPAGQRRRMQAELKRRAAKAGVSVTPGLGPAFVALAVERTRPGGRLAFILPVALATGKEWGSVRELLAETCRLETVVTSHDPRHPNFSENTSLSEIMFVARKGGGAGDTRFITLAVNPQEAAAARETARIMGAAAGYVSGCGYASAHPAGDAWERAIFLQPALFDAYAGLREGKFNNAALPVCRLDDLGEFGYDDRDMLDAFDKEQLPADATEFKTFRKHRSDEVRRIANPPNSSHRPRGAALPGRSLKDWRAVWAKRSDFLFACKIRFNTHRLMAIRTDVPVAGFGWKTFVTELDAARKQALALFCNSSLGMLAAYGRRTIIEGPLAHFSKHARRGQPALDVRELAAEQVRELAAAYDRLAGAELLSLSQLAADPVRAAIDAAVADALGLGDLAGLRGMLAAEPGVSG